jgi:hypothetical protein
MEVGLLVASLITMLSGRNSWPTGAIVTSNPNQECTGPSVRKTGFKTHLNRLSSALLILYDYLLLFSLRGVREQWVAVAVIQIIAGQLVASGVLCHRVQFCLVVHGIRSRCCFHTASDLGFTRASHDTRCYRLLPIVTSLWDDEDVEPAGHHEADNTPDQQEVPDDETHDVERVVVEAFKGGIGEAEDDGEDGSREVAEERSPDGR